MKKFKNSISVSDWSFDRIVNTVIITASAIAGIAQTIRAVSRELNKISVNYWN